MTVIVTTDEPLLEAGMRWILGQRPEFDLRGCRTSQELVRAVSESKPDVVLCALGRESRGASTRSVV